MLLAATLASCALGAQTDDGASDGADGREASQEELLGGWASDEKGNPRLDFSEDGTVTGTDGCNGISSSYTIEGSRVLVEQFASTLRACEGVDDWLRAVREVTVEGDTMIVKNGSGEEIGELQRDGAS